MTNKFANLFIDGTLDATVELLSASASSVFTPGTIGGDCCKFGLVGLVSRQNGA